MVQSFPIVPTLPRLLSLLWLGGGVVYFSLYFCIASIVVYHALLMWWTLVSPTLHIGIGAAPCLLSDSYYAKIKTLLSLGIVTRRLTV